VLWDEVDPNLFTPAQRQALVAWLHWGGQLVINGPDSLDLLKGSFLEPFLPATSGGGREIAAADLADLNEHWMIRTKSAGKKLAPRAPWSGVKLVSQLGPDEKDPLGESTGGLLTERSVGRGRIVVSAMQLSERELVNCKSGFESLFNGGITAGDLWRPDARVGRSKACPAAARRAVHDRLPLARPRFGRGRQLSIG
jgi:hypothetical protein